jgi:hypothetical protein
MSPIGNAQRVTKPTERLGVSDAVKIDTMPAGQPVTKPTERLGVSDTSIWASPYRSGWSDEARGEAWCLRRVSDLRPTERLGVSGSAPVQTKPAERLGVSDARCVLAWASQVTKPTERHRVSDSRPGPQKPTERHHVSGKFRQDGGYMCSL